MAKPPINAAEQTSADVALLLVRLGLILGFIVTPVVLLMSPRAIFVLSSIAVALVLVAGLLFAARPRVATMFGFLATRIGIACVFISVWALASLIWTPFPAEAAPRWFKIVSTFLCVLPVAYVLPERSRAANMYVLPIGVAAASIGAIILSSVFLASRQDVLANDTLARAMCVALLLLWPATMATVLRTRPTMAASVAIVAVAAALSVQAATALVATAAAALAFILARVDQAKTGLWIGRIGAASFVLAPLAPLLLGSLLGGVSGLSWLKAWSDIMIADGVRLLTGHGFNYVASGLSHGYLGAETPKSLLFEIWTDLGVLGALTSAALVYWAYGLAADHSRRTAPYWLGALTFVTALGVFGGATLQLWWITALALALVALILATRGDFQTERPTAPRQAV